MFFIAEGGILKFPTAIELFVLFIYIFIFGAGGDWPQELVHAKHAHCH